VKDPSPDARAFAGLIASLLDLALVAMLGFAFADTYAPPQDLPWKPLHIDQPIGWATSAKLERTVAQPRECLDFLRREEVEFAPVADRLQGEFCTVRDAGLIGPQPMALSPVRPVMSCPLAAAFAIWTRQSVVPAARELLDAEVAQIEHYGTYACRRVYGREEGRVSEHARAQAIDVAAIRLTDGRRIDLLSDWRDEGPEGAFLRRIRDDGCRLFRAALSPDYNAAHANHLHFDVGAYRLCRLTGSPFSIDRGRVGRQNFVANSILACRRRFALRDQKALGRTAALQKRDCLPAGCG
jgi:hypothetical protein